MLLIQRARRYSPHSEEKDWAILTEVGRLLGAEEVVSEDSFDTSLHSIQLLNTSLSKGIFQLINSSFSPWGVLRRP